MKTTRLVFATKKFAQLMDAFGGRRIPLIFCLLEGGIAVNNELIARIFKWGNKHPQFLKKQESKDKQQENPEWRSFMSEFLWDLFEALVFIKREDAVELVFKVMLEKGFVSRNAFKVKFLDLGAPLSATTKYAILKAFVAHSKKSNRKGSQDKKK